MTASQHKVLIVGSQRVRDVSLLPSDLDRLSAMADWEWLHYTWREVSRSARMRTPTLSGN